MQPRPRWLTVLFRVLMIALMIVSLEAGYFLLVLVYDQYSQGTPAPVPVLLLIIVAIPLILWPLGVAMRFFVSRRRARRERSGASKAT